MVHNYLTRMADLQRKIREEGLDAFLVTDQNSIYYLTGATYKPLERPFFIVVYPDTEPDLVVPELERAHMRKAKGFREVQAYFDYPSVAGECWHDKVNALIGGVSRLGVEPSVPVEITSKLWARMVIPYGFVNEIRLIKTEDEIECIRTAAKYADLGMEKLVGALYRGVSVVELFSLSRSLQLQLIKTGEFDPLASEFVTVGWPAPKSAQPHSIPDLGDRLESGPLALMCMLRVNGYAAECERTAFIGPPSGDEKALYHHMKKAREIAFSMVRPGASCSEIDEATRAYFKSEGLGGYILHRTGHGFGLGNHEAPWLSAGSKDILARNMVISIEPAIYLPEAGGYRHSDTVLVTENGYECLTTHPTTLEALTLRPSRPFKAMKGSLIRKAAGLNS